MDIEVIGRDIQIDSNNNNNTRHINVQFILFSPIYGFKNNAIGFINIKIMD